MKTIIFALLIALSIVTNARTVSWAGNVSSDEFTNLADFHARSSFVWPPIFNVAGYFSGSLSVDVDVDESASSGSVDVDTDAVLGLIGFLTAPFSTYMYFTGSVDVDFTSFDAALLDVDATLGYLLTTFLRIEERDDEGEVVESINLGRVLWGVEDEGTGSDDGLHYITVTASKDFSFGIWEPAPCDISITWYIADHYGKVLVEGGEETFTYPKNLESVITIDGYEYASETHNLVLIIGSCTGSADVQTSAGLSGTTFDAIVADNDLTIVYANSAIIDGESSTVTIQREFSLSFADAVGEQLSQFSADIDTAWNGAAECHSTEVGFTANAAKIWYDPGLSQGPLPSTDSDGTGDSSVLLLSAFAVVAALL